MGAAHGRVPRPRRARPAGVGFSPAAAATRAAQWRTARRISRESALGRRARGGRHGCGIGCLVGRSEPAGDGDCGCAFLSLGRSGRALLGLGRDQIVIRVDDRCLGRFRRWRGGPECRARPHRLQPAEGSAASDAEDSPGDSISASGTDESGAPPEIGGKAPMGVSATVGGRDSEAG